MKRKILFLGESYRADAQTWIKGLQQYGDFDIVTWELKTGGYDAKHRALRIWEYLRFLPRIRKLIEHENPDMVIAERTTSYGFLAALSGVKPFAIAQQGRTDLWPENSILLPIKRVIQRYAFRKADLIHAWGEVMTHSMIASKVDMQKVLVMPKGIDIERFNFETKPPLTKIKAIVTRSLLPEYRHYLIIEACKILKSRSVEFEVVIIGDGAEFVKLNALVKKYDLANHIIFTGKIENSLLPTYLNQANIYISMPVTEGVSASLFEAMAAGCFPVVSKIPGNSAFIKDCDNGLLVDANPEELAEKLIWCIINAESIKLAVNLNREFVVKHANFHVNMKFIAARYHELIDKSLTCAE